jgi:phenylacetate-coenzyme A ligase PaaK-like adenylate-forming protein
VPCQLIANPEHEHVYGSLLLMSSRRIAEKFVRVLEACENDSRQEMQRYQRSLLERLCRHARKSVPFYEDRLGVLFNSRDEFNLDRWQEVPVLTRRDAILHKEALTSTDIPSNFGQLSEARTSGSTGEPVRILKTETELLVSGAMVDRFYKWHKFDPSRRLARLVSRPLSGENAAWEWQLDHWGRSFLYTGIKGPMISFNAQASIGQQVDWLEKQKPKYLTVNPRMGLALVNEYERRQSRPSFQLRGIRTFGETKNALADAKMKALFGCRPRSIYTAEDIGHMAVECPSSGTYHVCDEILRLDIVDSQGKAVSADEPGRVLVTPLYGYAMPRIRYEIGDEATFMSHCPCNRPHATVSHILGRTSNLFLHPDGHRFRPERDVLNEAYEHLDALAVQIAQLEARHFEVRFQKNPHSGTTVNEAAMAQAMTQSFGYQANVEFVCVDLIPAKTNGKREDFVCEVDP